MRFNFWYKKQSKRNRETNTLSPIHLRRCWEFVTLKILLVLIKQINGRACSLSFILHSGEEGIRTLEPLRGWRFSKPLHSATMRPLLLWYIITSILLLLVCVGTGRAAPRLPRHGWGCGDLSLLYIKMIIIFDKVFYTTTER